MKPARRTTARSMFSCEYTHAEPLNESDGTFRTIISAFSRGRVYGFLFSGPAFAATVGNQALR